MCFSIWNILVLLIFVCFALSFFDFIELIREIKIMFSGMRSPLPGHLISVSAIALTRLSAPQSQVSQRQKADSFNFVFLGQANNVPIVCTHSRCSQHDYLERSWIDQCMTILDYTCVFSPQEIERFWKTHWIQLLCGFFFFPQRNDISEWLHCEFSNLPAVWPWKTFLTCVSHLQE